MAHTTNIGRQNVSLIGQQKLVYRWIIDDRVISIVKAVNNFAYIIHDRASDTRTEGSIPSIPALSKEQLIDCLIEDGKPEVRNGQLYFTPIFSKNSTLAHRWIFDKKIIDLINTINGLSFLIKGRNKITTIIGSVASIPGLSTEQLIEVLIESQPKIQGENLCFKPNHSAILSWNKEDKKAYLTGKTSKLYWRIIDKTIKTTYQIDFENTFIRAPNNRYFVERFCDAELRATRGPTGEVVRNLIIHETSEVIRMSSMHDYSEQARSWPYSDELISGKVLRQLVSSKVFREMGSFQQAEEITLKELEDRNYKMLVAFLSELTLENIETNADNSKKIILHPAPIEKSELDPHILIDKFKSAITLVNTADWYGHAVVIIETMIDKNYGMYKAHLILGDKIHLKHAPGKVVFYKVDHKTFSYKSKTETWTINTSKAHQMITRWAEMDKKQKDKEVVAYYYAPGSNALFAKKTIQTPQGPVDVHNCMTWALDELKLVNINLDPSKYGWLCTLPTEYATPYSKSLKNESDL